MQPGCGTVIICAGFWRNNIFPALKLLDFIQVYFMDNILNDLAIKSLRISSVIGQTVLCESHSSV